MNYIKHRIVVYVKDIMRITGQSKDEDLTQYEAFQELHGKKKRPEGLLYVKRLIITLRTLSHSPLSSL